MAIALRSYLKAVGKHWWTLLSCAVFTLLGLYVAYANKDNGWIVKVTFTVASALLLVACFLAWQDEHNSVLQLLSDKKAIEESYFDERPQIGLEISGPEGPKEWREAIRSDSCRFLLTHLSGRKPRSIKFDPIPSKNGRFTLNFYALPFLDTPRSTPLTYHIGEIGFARLSAHDLDQTGDREGELLGMFLDDSPNQLMTLDYVLTIRFKDKVDEERVRKFNIIFDKNTYSFLANTD